MATYENAMDKLRDEMAKKHDHPGVGSVGEYLTGRLRKDHALADRFCETGKSIEGAFEAIRAYARKIQKGGQAYVTDDKGFEIVCEYYGIPAENGAQTSAHTQETAKADELDLDALLGL